MIKTENVERKDSSGISPFQHSRYCLATRMKKPLLILILLLPFFSSMAQKKVPFSTIPDTTIQSRVWILSGATAALYGAGLAALNTAWYKGYPREGFHFFNDMGEWNQVDKTGHIFSAYFIGKYSREMWRWSGLPRKKQIWIGGLSGFGINVRAKKEVQAEGGEQDGVQETFSHAVQKVSRVELISKKQLMTNKKPR